MSPPARPGSWGLASSLAAACVAAAIAGWLGGARLLATSTMAVVMLTLAFGWGRSLRSGVLWSLVGIFALFSGVLLTMAAVDAPNDAPRLWLGLPPATALLVYLIWPLGVLPSLVYAFYFRDTVLPEDRLQAFLAAHSRHNKR